MGSFFFYSRTAPFAVVSMTVPNNFLSCSVSKFPNELSTEWGLNLTNSTFLTERNIIICRAFAPIKLSKEYCHFLAPKLFENRLCNIYYNGHLTAPPRETIRKNLLFLILGRNHESQNLRWRGKQNAWNEKKTRLEIGLKNKKIK